MPHDGRRARYHRGFRAFKWRAGYFAFTIGQSGEAGLKRYIAGPKEHHKRVDFLDEVREFLRK